MKLTNGVCPPNTFSGFRGRVLVDDLDCQNNPTADATCVTICEEANLPWSVSDCCIGTNVCLCSPYSEPTSSPGHEEIQETGDYSDSDDHEDSDDDDQS